MAGVIKDLRTFSIAVNAAFKLALQGNSGSPIDELFTDINMTTKKVEFPIAGRVGPLREWKGSRIVSSVMRNSYEIVAKKFEKTISLPVEDQEDDNLDVYMPAIRTLAVQVANWKSQQGHKVIEANGLGYDGQPFFSASHPENGLSASNYQVGASPAWYMIDASKPIKPWIWGTRVAPTIKPKTADSDDNVFWRDELIWGARARGGGGYGRWQTAFKSKAALTGPNLEAAEAAMRSRADEQGESLDIVPTLVLVPPALKWDALRLFGPATISGSDNIYQNAYRVVVSNRLTGV